MADEPKASSKKSPAKKQKNALSKQVSMTRGKIVAGIAIVAVASSAVTAGIVHAKGGTTASPLGKYQLSDSELDTVVARYTYEGKTHDVTANEVYAANGGASANTDGSYTAPAAEDIISYVRSQLLSDALDKQGINVTDDEVSTYASSNYGSDDYDTLASNYGVSEDFIKSYIASQARTMKAYDQIVGESSATSPDMPTMQDGDTEDSVRPEYATYIISLAGDEWDSDTGTWKDPSSKYASALADYDITNDGASYKAAEAAYDVAYSDYVDEVTAAQGKWTAFTNGIYDQTSFTLLYINS